MISAGPVRFPPGAWEPQLGPPMGLCRLAAGGTRGAATLPFQSLWASQE